MVYRRLLAYFAFYLAVMAVVLAEYSSSTSYLKGLDFEVFGYFYRTAEPPTLSSDIVLIDIPYNDTDRGEYRQRLGRLLRKVAGDTRNRPKAVLLDVAITKDTLADIVAVEDGIGALQNQDILVFAAVDPRQKNSEALDPQYLDCRSEAPDPQYLDCRHVRSIYVELLNGYGHTRFQVPNYFDTPLMYDTYLNCKRSLPLPVTADFPPRSGYEKL